MPLLVTRAALAGTRAGFLFHRGSGPRWFGDRGWLRAANWPETETGVRHRNKKKPQRASDPQAAERRREFQERIKGNGACFVVASVGGLVSAWLFSLFGGPLFFGKGGKTVCGVEPVGPGGCLSSRGGPRWVPLFLGCGAPKACAYGRGFWGVGGPLAFPGDTGGGTGPPSGRAPRAF